MDRNRGKLYHNIPHPDFAGWPTAHGNMRFEVLKPHLTKNGGTVLDIGTHWGQFAHWLEDQGYKVVAVEHSPEYAYIARGIRDICDKSFEVIEGSIFDVQNLTYDIVLALNIFHHFLKTEKGYRGLLALLHRLDCELMFFQAHDPKERQMEGAYKNMDQDEFVAFVAKEGRFSKVEEIGAERIRRIFKLTR